LMLMNANPTTVVVELALFAQILLDHLPALALLDLHTTMQFVLILMNAQRITVVAL